MFTVHKNFKIFVIILTLAGLMLTIYISEATTQEKSYQRVFPEGSPESISPEPDEIKTRESREQMQADVLREKQALEAEQKDLKPVKEKPAIVVGAPTKIYYRIAVNDKLYISTWRVPDLSSEFIVGPDGNISFPLIGDIRAADKTISELDAEITEKLKEYVENPQVSITIREFAGDRVVVLGEVRGPGVYKFVGKTKIINIIALAGGFTDRAKSASIVIVRESEDPQKEDNLIVVGIKSVLKGNISDNIEVKPNDIIYVSRTFVSNVKEFYDNWIVPAVNKVIDYESYKSVRRSRHQ